MLRRLHCRWWRRRRPPTRARRRPSRGPLSKFPDPASSFRNPGKDFLRGFNALGIVIELPEDMLIPAGAGTDPVLGIWATTSR